jgi:hypothetical protein
LAKTKAEFRDIYQDTAALFFFACHHNGAHPDFEENFRGCVRVELGATKSKKIAAVHSLDDDEAFSKIKDVMGLFNELGMSLPIRTFAEKKSTTWLQKRVFRDKESIVSAEVPSDLEGLPANTSVAVSDGLVLYQLGRRRDHRV